MTCWSCAHYRHGDWCALRNRKAEKVCRLFDYEPGADEGERA